MSADSRFKILGVAVHAIDKFAGLPLWKYSMSFAYLKAYPSQYAEYQAVSFETRDFYQNESLQSIVSEVAAARPRMVLFSVYVWNYLIYAELARRIKLFDPSILIVLGGPEVAEDTEVILQENPAFDVVVTGEGEYVFYELVHSWLADGSCASVAGITHRQAGQIIVNPPADPLKLADINCIPSIFTDEFVAVERLTDSFAALETQRGCNFSCGFCRYRKIGQGARFFELKRVFADLDFLKKAKIKHLYIMDPTFNNDKERAKTILRYIIELDMNVEINAEMVPEFFDEELLALALQAGIKNLEVGVQSIRKETLKIMQRPRNARKLEERIEGAALLHVGDQKFNVIPQIIFGLPGDDIDAYGESFNFVYNLSVDEVAMYHLLILRDTQFYRDRDIHGFVFERDPPHRVISSKTWPKEAILLAGKMSSAAVGTQYLLRQHIRQYCRQFNLTPAEFFVDRLKIAEFPDELAFAFPIYESRHAALMTAVTERVGEVHLEANTDSSLENAVRQMRRLFKLREQLVMQRAA